MCLESAVARAPVQIPFPTHHMCKRMINAFLSHKDPRSWIPNIQDPGSCRILDLIFSFSHGILEILDPTTQHCRGIPRTLDPGQKIFCWILGILDPA